jgi:hypothetical protein
VEELHSFFVSWFQGATPNDDATWARIERVLAPGFLLVSPDGTRTDRAALLAQLRSLHGCRAGQALAIHTEDATVRLREGPLALVTYVERQYTHEGTTRRFSTALLREDPGAPWGWVWLHVHETWIEDQASG